MVRVRPLILLMAMAMAGVGCVHAQKPERRIYRVAESAEGVGSSLGTGGSGFRDCDAEHVECFDACWNTTPLPYPYTRRDGWYREHCTRKCREQYVECEKENEKKARELKFSSVDAAMEWIGHHKAEVALGTVVIIAGVAFVLTTGGAGALVLAPLAL